MPTKYYNLTCSPCVHGIVGLLVGRGSSRFTLCFFWYSYLVFCSPNTTILSCVSLTTCPISGEKLTVFVNLYANTDLMRDPPREADSIHRTTHQFKFPG